ETLVQNFKLLARVKIPADKKFYIGDVKIVSLKSLRDDAAKTGQLLANYNTALQAKTSGTIVGGVAPAGGGFGAGEPMAPAAPGGFGAAPAAAAAPGGAPGAADQFAFQDRQVPDEDVRDDQEFVAVATVVLDPPT